MDHFTFGIRSLGKLQAPVLSLLNVQYCRQSTKAIKASTLTDNGVLLREFLIQSNPIDVVKNQLTEKVKYEICNMHESHGI